MPDSPKLSPEEAKDQLNAILKDNDPDFRGKFVADKQGVHLEIPKEVAEGFAKNGISVADVTGSKSFGQDKVRGPKAQETWEAAQGQGGFTGMAAKKAAEHLPKEEVITANGVTAEDVKAFGAHFDAIKPALSGNFDAAKAKVAEFKASEAEAAHPADPHKAELAKALNVQGSALEFKSEGGAVVAHLDPKAATNLEAVLASGVKASDLFGSDKITYDPTKHTVTAASDLQASDPAVAAFTADSKAINVAVRMSKEDGGPDIVKGLIKPHAELQQHEGNDPHHGLTAAVQQTALAAARA